MAASSSSPTPAPVVVASGLPHTRLNPNPKRREELKGLAKPPPPIFNPPLLIHDVVPAAPRETSRHASGSSYTHWRMGPSLFWTHASSKIICLTERREKDGRNALALDVQRSADALCYAHSDLWTQGTVGPTVSMERAGFASKGLVFRAMAWKAAWKLARVLTDMWALVFLSPPIIEIRMEA